MGGETCDLPDSITLPKFLIKEGGVSDSEIITERPKGHTFERAYEFCQMLASQLKKQKGGKEVKDGLRIDGKTESFHVRTADKKKVLPVFVYWCSYDQSFYVLI